MKPELLFFCPLFRTLKPLVHSGYKLPPIQEKQAFVLQTTCFFLMPMNRFALQRQEVLVLSRFLFLQALSGISGLIIRGIPGELLQKQAARCWL